MDCCQDSYSQHKYYRQTFDELKGITISAEEHVCKLRHVTFARVNNKTLFRWIANLEGVSFLVLLLIAMPLKYYWDKPWMVQQVGMAHGVLFVAYVIAVLLMRKTFSWNAKKTLLALFLSFVPLGTFYVTGKMLRREKTWRENLPR